MGHFTNLFITCLASLLVFVYLLNIKAGIHSKKKINANVNNTSQLGL